MTSEDEYRASCCTACDSQDPDHKPGCPYAGPEDEKPRARARITIAWPTVTVTMTDQEWLAYVERVKAVLNILGGEVEEVRRCKS